MMHNAVCVEHSVELLASDEGWSEMWCSWKHTGCSHIQGNVEAVSMQLPSVLQKE